MAKKATTNKTKKTATRPNIYGILDGLLHHNTISSEFNCSLNLEFSKPINYGYFFIKRFWLRFLRPKNDFQWSLYSIS